MFTSGKVYNYDERGNIGFWLKYSVCILGIFAVLNHSFFIGLPVSAQGANSAGKQIAYLDKSIEENDQAAEKIEASRSAKAKPVKVSPALKGQVNKADKTNDSRSFTFSWQMDDQNPKVFSISYPRQVEGMLAQAFQWLHYALGFIVSNSRTMLGFAQEFSRQMTSLPLFTPNYRVYQETTVLKLPASAKQILTKDGQVKTFVSK